MAEVEGTLSQPEVYQRRVRVCDLGYLREAYQTPEGRIGFRCASEPIEQYLAKGVKPPTPRGASACATPFWRRWGWGSYRKTATAKLPLVTSGDDLERIGRFVRQFGTEYSARDVVAYLLGTPASSQPEAQPVMANG